MLFKKIVFSNIMSRFTFKVLIVLLSFTINSCKWFESKEAITDRIIKQDMQTIDWNQIDRYPLFANCDEAASKVSQQRCFALELQLRVAPIIENIKQNYTKELTELKAIVIEVDLHGKLNLKEVEYGDYKMNSALDSVIQIGLHQIEALYPAIKRGVPVSVVYKMPFKVAVKQ